MSIFLGRIKHRWSFEEPHSMASPTPQSALHEEHIRQRPLILLVEDNEAVLKIIRRMLEDGGYGVVGVRDAEQALLLMDQLCPDLVITDLMLPAQNGLDFAQEICALRPSLRCIVMSGHIFTVPGDHPASATLLKPIAQKELFETISQVLAHPRGGIVRPAVVGL